MALNVVLTGSTGQLGNYILHTLLHTEKIDRVYCLNRSADAQKRQEKLLAARGLSAPSSRVEFHQADFSIPGLSLSSNTYRTLTESITHIIHCAWPVDWNQTFTSFDPSIRGVANLIDLASAAQHSPQLFFISSVAAVGNWGAVPGARDSVPEEEVDDWKVARFGYGQSKLVAERLLADSSRTRRVTTAICRVGQVCGPVDHDEQGQWPKQEWLPSLVASSKYLGMLPKTLGPGEIIDWVPVDRLSSIVVELLLGNRKKGAAHYYHVRNPQAAEWRAIAPGLGRIMTSKMSKEIPLVGLIDWVNALEASRAAADLEQNPAVKLLPFFQNLRDRHIRSPRARAAILEIDRTTKCSETLSNLEAVNKQWISLWMQQWEF